MKNYIVLFSSIFFFSETFAQADEKKLPENTAAYEKPIKKDTVHEWVHLSLSPRHNSVVLNRKALAVQVNGKCIKHLFPKGRKFPVHYHVGWCEGKEKLFNRLIVN